MWDLLFLRFPLPLDTGAPSDSRRKGRGMTESEPTGGFTEELLSDRWAAPFTRGGEWTAEGEERHMWGKMTKYKSYFRFLLCTLGITLCNTLYFFYICSPSKDWHLQR